MKISQLIALLGADAADNDLLTIVDTSATATKKITVAEARIALVTSARIIAALGYTPEADGQGVIRSATVTLTAADLAALDTVPFELVAAPGANKVIVPISASAAFLLGGGEIDFGALDGLAVGWDGAVGSAFVVGVSGPNTEDSFTLGVAAGLSIALASVSNKSVVLSPSGTFGAPVPGAIATSAIAAAGTGYVALETVTRGNATIRIDTVGGGGEVLTYTVTVAGTNNIVGAAQATTGGSGANFTVDINTVNVSVNPMTLTVKTLYSVMDVA